MTRICHPIFSMIKITLGSVLILKDGLGNYLWDVILLQKSVDMLRYSKLYKLMNICSDIGTLYIT